MACKLANEIRELQKRMEGMKNNPGSQFPPKLWAAALKVAMAEVAKKFNRNALQNSWLSAEKYIAEILGGKTTSTHCEYDVVTEEGYNVEVKYSQLGEGCNYRWRWLNMFGLGGKGKKSCDVFVFAGAKDDSLKDTYPDNSPYAFFVMSAKDVKKIMAPYAKSEQGRRCLYTNPRLIGRFGKLLKPFLTKESDLKNAVKLAGQRNEK